jgi:hypothetical protein
VKELELGVSKILFGERLYRAERAYKFLVQSLSTTEDGEKLLHASHEVWGEVHTLPYGAPGVDLRAGLQQNLALTLRFGEGLFDHVGDRLTHAIGMLEGNHVDTRDADTIADEFLRRVEGLQELRQAETNEALQQARRDVLDGVQKPYLPKVLERILDREEEAAPAKDAEALRDDREGRRERGWRALTSAEASKKPRGR